MARLLQSRQVLLIAFAFTVMGDPVSSVAYAIEAALRALDGDLALLIPTMAIVVAIIGLVISNYHRLLGRFPGGGDAAAAGTAFGDGWAFLPLGSLIVDYALTIAISVAAASSAIIAFQPGLAPARIPLAVVLLTAVAGLTLFGHHGRSLFALMTISFVVIGSIVIVIGLIDPAGSGGSPLTPAGYDRSPPLAVLLAFPVAMALATGVEAPSSAVAQLGQLDRPSQIMFGRVTLWLTFVVVGWLTLGLTVLAVRLRVGVPGPDSTQIANLAKASVGSGPLFGAFQLASAVLLLAAASSSFQAGPGLLKALSQAPAASASFTAASARPTPITRPIGALACSCASRRWSWWQPVRPSRSSCCSMRSRCLSRSSSACSRCTASPEPNTHAGSWPSPAPGSPPSPSRSSSIWDGCTRSRASPPPS